MLAYPETFLLDLELVMRPDSTTLSIAVFSLVAFSWTATQPCRAQSDNSQFEWMLGNWEGVRRSSQDGKEAPMKVRVERILGGVGLVQQIEVKVDETNTYRGHAVQAFDAELNRHVRQYVNASRGRFVRLEADVMADRVVWQSSSPKRKSQLVSERTSSDRWRRIQSYSDDDGMTWSVIWTDELVKRPDAER